MKNLILILAISISFGWCATAEAHRRHHEHRGYYHDHWYYGPSYTNPYYRPLNYYHCPGHYYEHSRPYRRERNELHYDGHHWGYRYSW